MSELKRSNEEISNSMETQSDAKKAKTEENVPKRPMFRVEPYLYFPGNCKEAIDFYVECFAGKVAFITYYKDAPAGDFAVDAADADKVMHASMTFKDGDDDSTENTLMFSDYVAGKCGGMDEHIVGTNLHLSIGMSNLPRMLEIWKNFEKHEKTKITMPLAKQFWGSTYGNLIDPFGIRWMFSGPSDEPSDNKN